MTRRGWGVVLALSLGVAPGAAAQVSPAPGFDHVLHEDLFPDCVACHGGAADAGASLWPAAASCAVCHDAAVEERVEWTPPPARRASNLRFEHSTHDADVAADGGEPLGCTDCHAGEGDPWMTVRIAVADRCLACHEVAEEHLAVAGDACATCHVPLAEATRLTEDRIGRFSEPPSHGAAAFAGAAHGALAEEAGGAADGSCATCHARDFCAQCHVDAPEQPAIWSLGVDARSLVHGAVLEAPASHEGAAFLEGHWLDDRGIAAGCGTCHSRNSCTACHVATTEVARQLQPAGAGRGRGAVIVREPPGTHTPGFEARHGSEANGRPATCAGCHAQEDCLQCHRPDPAAGTGGYHPSGFLVRHPAAAYGRETSCADCHQPAAFCVDCHAAAGLTARGALLGAGYHDAKRAFSLGHGVAARQQLESCVTCHVEGDCLACHSAAGGRGFSPHGPGFDPDRLQARNPDLCWACHIGGRRE